MSALRDTIQRDAPMWLACGGLLVGFTFGAVTYRTNFCTMGALSDIVNLGDWRRFRAWLLAAATALAGAQILDMADVVQLSGSMYLTPNFNWLGNMLGGLMFGAGMVFAGGCASRNLVRAGSGDLRALLTLVILGVFAYMAIGGLLGPLRAALEQATSVALPSPTQSLGDLAALATGLGSRPATKILAVLVVAAVAIYCFADAGFRSSPVHVWSGLGVGGVVVAGWFVTGIAFDELAIRPVAPVSLTYVRPVGDTLEWLERFTAGPMPGFGVATVLGSLLGAFAASLAKGRFRLSTFFDTGDTLRSLLGAALMGVGGVLALGCTVGQAITGISTLAAGSFLTFGAIVFGGLAGFRLLERWLMAEG